MKFAIRMIDYACDCGTPATAVRIGVTSLGELAAVWDCEKCKMVVMTRIAIENLVQKIPPSPEQLLIAPPAITDDDESLLEKMHIKWDA